MRNDTCNIEEICMLKSKKQKNKKVTSCVNNAYLKCVWQISVDKHDIIFYMADMEKSKIVVWDCIWNKIKKTKEFDFSLLRTIDGGDSDTGMMTKFLSKYSFIIIDNDYYMPKIWIKYDYESIIVQNPLINSYIALYGNTRQNIVDQIINEILNGNEVQISEPVFIGNSIFFLGEKEGLRVVYKLLF